MHEIKVTRYVCDYCGNVYGNKNACKQHEKYDHKCKECDHAYYVYGCEFNCARENQGKPCRFKKKVEVSGDFDE